VFVLIVKINAKIFRQQIGK